MGFLSHRHFQIDDQGLVIVLSFEIATDCLASENVNDCRSGQKSVLYFDIFQAFDFDGIDWGSDCSVAEVKEMNVGHDIFDCFCNCFDYSLGRRKGNETEI